MPTVLPSGTVWDDEQGRIHLGIEQLRLQGTMLDDAAIRSRKVSNSQFQDLAGNACLDLQSDQHVNDIW